MADSKFDKLIKETIILKVDETKIPPADMMWQGVLKSVRLKRRQQNLKRLKPIAAIIVIIVTICVLFLSFEQPVTAFTIKVIKSITKMTNDIYQVRKSTNIKDSKGDILSLLSDDSRVGEAQKKVKFKLLLPSFVPDGFSLSQIDIKSNYENKESIIMLFINNSESSKNKSFEITQQSFPGNGNETFDSRTTNGTSLKEILISGAEGLLIEYSKDYHVLTWEYDNISFKIDGQLSENEIIKVAKSLK